MAAALFFGGGRESMQALAPTILVQKRRSVAVDDMADDGRDREVEHHGAGEGGDPQPWLHIGIVRMPVVGTRANNSHGGLLSLTANAAWRRRFPEFAAGGPTHAAGQPRWRSCRPLRNHQLC